MTDVFLNVKRIRRVWFPENINGLYPLGKAEIGEDVYALNEAIRGADSSSASAADSQQNVPPNKTQQTKKQMQKALRAEESKALKQRLDSMKANFATQRATLARIRTEIKRHRENIGRTAYEIETTKEEQKSLEENYQSLKEDYTQSIKSSNHNREGYQKSIREIRDQLQHDTKLPAEIFGSINEIQRLKQEIQNRNDRCTELRNNLKNATRQRNMMQDVLTKQNASPTPGAVMTHQVVDYARSNAKQFETFKLKLRDSLEKKKKTHQDLERRKREIQSLTEDLDKQAKLNADLKDKDRELGQKTEQQKQILQDLQDQVKQLKDEETKREQEIDQLNEQHKNWEQMLVSTEKRAQVVETAFTKNMIELQTFSLGKRTLEMTTESLNKKQKLLKDEESEINSQIKKHEKRGGVDYEDKDKLDSLIETCRSLYHGKLELEKEVEEKEAENDKKSKDVAALKSQLEEAQDRLQEQQEECVKQLNVATKLAAQENNSK
mmetsp:Transcript_30004/g.52665  ORF Transcript_30004/g.52665 Transcript_30004/m.52665 type:complete len:494 (+) Transcript_30004:236-1717(+)|eukprot:CAMPEP_0197515816 /NCGR_PEP_ID=MMETSP1318-20131121/820_1 /TAXON_ID=552666 /ORGANISM="Partenskyella glossopodia, Strain RCC365" /LENGTH=493 /DNA_ID=CAMNT_0043064279 /DNA_START=232 /DNA_END=1713 /DNA_ORIENTATION=-